MLEAAGVCSLGVVTPKVGEAFVVHRLVLRRSKGLVGGHGSALAGKAPLHRVSAAPRQTVVLCIRLDASMLSIACTWNQGISKYTERGREMKTMFLAFSSCKSPQHVLSGRTFRTRHCFACLAIASRCPLLDLATFYGITSMISFKSTLWNELQSTPS